MIAIVFVLALILTLLAGILVGSLMRKQQARSKARERNGRAQRGEVEAPAILRAAGYRVVETQARRLSIIEVDGEEKPFGLRADLIVQDSSGRRFVADVKTGKEAPKPTNASTRRQLLEYVLIYQVEGVLLVDMEQRKVMRVKFPRHRERAR